MFDVHRDKLTVIISRYTFMKFVENLIKSTNVLTDIGLKLYKHLYFRSQCEYLHCSANVLCSAKLRSFLRVNITWEVTEGSRSVATVYSQTHLLCILYIYLLWCSLLFITDHQRHLSPVSYSQWQSPRESVPRLLLHSPKSKNPLSTEMMLLVEIKI
jgi:hypothetical protein